MVLEVILVLAALAIVGYSFYKRFIKDNDKAKDAITSVVDDMTDVGKSVKKDVKETAAVVKDKTETAVADVKDTAKEVKAKV